MRRKDLFIILFSIIMVPRVFAQPNELTQSSALQALQNKIKEKYGLEVKYQDISRVAAEKLIFEPASSGDYKELLQYMVLLQEELSKYPANFYKKSQLKSVVLVKKLFYK